MKKVIFGVLITLVGVLIFRACTDDKKDTTLLQEESMLIQEQISNVSKLIVTEGHFAEVYTYKDSQELFGALLTADKKALVVVNAEVIVAYDLSALDVKIDEENKSVYLTRIPEPEIKINPDFEYYDVSADYLNPFEASDYNTIKDNVNASLLQKIKASNLKKNAQNRLVGELQKLYFLTNSMGWKMVYNDQPVKNDFFEFAIKK